MKRTSEIKKENRRFGKWLFAIFGIITLVCAAYLSFFAPTHTVYSYDVKAEQVYDNDRINESVELDRLTGDEQAILHDAFKKSDHFLGSSQVTIERQEQLETFDGWKVVEFQGVYILVAVDGPDERTTWSGDLPWVVFVISIITVSTALVGLKEIIAPSPFQ